MLNTKAPLLTTRAPLVSFAQRVHGPRDESPARILDEAPLWMTPVRVVSCRTNICT